MCDFIDRLEEKGKVEGKLELLADLIADGTLTIKQAAERVGMTVLSSKPLLRNLVFVSKISVQNSSASSYSSEVQAERFLPESGSIYQLQTGNKSVCSS